MTDLQALRSHFRAQKSALFESLAASGTSTRGVSATLSKLSRLADTTLTTLWQRSGFASHCSLLAVGGFGRGELFPYSDVDVLVLLPDEQSAQQEVQLKIESFIGSCWDTGLEIGSSVRSVTECLQQATQDITVQ